MSDDTMIEMGALLEQHMRRDSQYSLTHCTAVLFGSQGARSRSGLGHIGKRWTGWNRGEQAGAVDDLVRAGLLVWVQRGKRTEYQLA